MLDTPCFILDKQKLDNNIKLLKDALEQEWSNYIFGYSFKTNSLPWLINYMKNEDIYAEVVSPDEYNLAKYMGYNINNIIYNGPCKTKDTFFEILNFGGLVNIDSNFEIDWLEELSKKVNNEYSIGIRVNLDIEQYCPNESLTGNDGGRFGFCFENGELARVIHRIEQMSNITIKGLHLHVSSRTKSLNIYRTLSKYACLIKNRFNLSLDYIDIGGGFFGDLDGAPTFKEYIQVIKNELVNGFDCKKVKLIVEPGAAIIASPISFISSVTDVKKTTKNNFVYTDASRINIDPQMTKNKYFHKIKYVNKTKREILNKQTIVGFTCMEKDRLFRLENCKALIQGDRIIYNNIGAYTMCLSPLFIKYFPDVYLLDNGKYILIREKWSCKEYLGKERY